MMRPFHPRAAALTDFFHRIHEDDFVAPEFGTERFADYLASH